MRKSSEILEQLYLRLGYVLRRLVCAAAYGRTSRSTTEAETYIKNLTSELYPMYTVTSLSELSTEQLKAVHARLRAQLSKMGGSALRQRNMLLPEHTPLEEDRRLLSFYRQSLAIIEAEIAKHKE